MPDLLSDRAPDPLPRDDLEIALSSPDVARSQEAARALLAQRPPGVATVTRLAAAVRDPAVTTRRRAVNLLGQLGPAALPAAAALAMALRDPSWTVREASARALGACAASARPDEVRRALLVAALDDRNRLVRDSAARALAALAGVGDREALDSLRAGLVHPHPSVRRRALRALVLVSHEGATVVPDLRHALDDSHRKVRRDAAKALGQLGGAALPALPGLIKRLHDGEPMVREAAGGALAILAPTLPGFWRDWLAILCDPRRTPIENLLAGLEHDALPEGTRRAFVALCRRRLLWHARLDGHDAPVAIVPAAAPATAAGVVLDAAGDAGRGESAWLLAQLVQLLGQDQALIR